MDSENLTYKGYLSPPPFEGGSGWVLSFILKNRRKVTKKNPFLQIFYDFSTNSSKCLHSLFSISKPLRSSTEIVTYKTWVILG